MIPTGGRRQGRTINMCIPRLARNTPWTLPRSSRPSNKCMTPGDRRQPTGRPTAASAKISTCPSRTQSKTMPNASKHGTKMMFQSTALSTMDAQELAPILCLNAHRGRIGLHRPDAQNRACRALIRDAGYLWALGGNANYQAYFLTHYYALRTHSNTSALAHRIPPNPRRENTFCARTQVHIMKHRNNAIFIFPPQDSTLPHAPTKHVRIHPSPRWEHALCKEHECMQ